MKVHYPRPTDWPHDTISFVSCGDGSVNNSEWLSAVNAAELMARIVSIAIVSVAIVSIAIVSIAIVLSTRPSSWRA